MKIQLMVLAVTLGTTLPFVTSPSAHSETTETVISGQFITLISIADAQAMETLNPGQPIRWEVGVAAHTPTLETIDIGIAASGILAKPGNLTLTMYACTERWVESLCPGTESLWLPQQDLAAAIATTNPRGIRHLDFMPSDQQRWLLMSVDLVSDPPPGTSADIQIYGSGNTEEINTGNKTVQLAQTGLPYLPMMLAATAILLGLGTAAIAARTHSRRKI